MNAARKLEKRKRNLKQRNYRKRNYIVFCTGKWISDVFISVINKNKNIIQKFY